MSMSSQQIAYLDKMRNMAEDAIGSARGMQDETQKRVFEALNNKTWGASSTVLMEIAKETNSYEKFGKIFKILWEAAESQPRNWRKIFKALMLAEYLVKNGCERCVDEIRDHTWKIRALQEFQYIEERTDRGQGVREKAKQLLELLSDNQTIRDAREQARRLRDKFVGVGGGSGGRFSTEGFGGGSYSDKGEQNGANDDGSSRYGGSSYVGGRYDDPPTDTTTGRYDEHSFSAAPSSKPQLPEEPAEPAIVPALSIRMKPKAGAAQKGVPRFKMKGDTPGLDTTTASPLANVDDAPSTDLFDQRAQQEDPSADFADFDSAAEPEQPSTDLFNGFHPAVKSDTSFDPRGADTSFADFAEAAPTTTPLAPTPPPEPSFDAFDVQPTAFPPMQQMPQQFAAMPTNPYAAPPRPQMMMPPPQQFPAMAVPPATMGLGMSGGPPMSGGGPMSGGPMSGQQRAPQQQQDGDFGDFGEAQAAPASEPPAPKKDAADSLVSLDGLSLNVTKKATKGDGPAKATKGGAPKADYAQHAAFSGLDGFTTAPQPSMYARPTQPAMGQAPMGQAPMGQAPMGQAPMGQAPMGQAPMGQPMMGQPMMGGYYQQQPGMMPPQQQYMYPQQMMGQQPPHAANNPYAGGGMGGW